MKKIDSFTVDHVALDPGVYISRVDTIGDRKLYTYDLRMTSPNDQVPLEMNGVHTMEHTGQYFYVTMKNTATKSSISDRWDAVPATTLS